MSISNKIIDSVVAEMVASAREMGEMGDVVVIPNTFEVYIHEDDFRDVRHFVKELREQIIKRLDKEVAARGGASSPEGGGIASLVNRLLGFDAFKNRKRHVRVQERWNINFTECDGEILIGDEVLQVKKGEVGTVRHFSSTAPQAHDSRFGTIVTIYDDGDLSRKSVIGPEPGPNRGLATQPVFASGIERSAARDAPTATHFATLAYKYKGSSDTHIYHMDKEHITVGRRTDDDAADLVLANVSERISRKHLEIRVDGDTGKFFLKSMGAFGTTVNGVRVPDNRGVATQESAREFELPDGARISLAGGEVLIDFSAG